MVIPLEPPKANKPCEVFKKDPSANSWPCIPSAMEKLFHPFNRKGPRPSQQGLGLGLFIASEIAHGHGGELFVHSDETETRFTLRFKTRI